MQPGAAADDRHGERQTQHQSDHRADAVGHAGQPRRHPGQPQRRPQTETRAQDDAQPQLVGTLNQHRTGDLGHRPPLSRPGTAQLNGGCIAHLVGDLDQPLADAGFVWVRGGNVFVLRMTMARSGFDEAIVAAVELSTRYITSRFLPDKAIDLVDEAASRLRLEMNSVPEEIDTLDRRVRQLEIEREAIRRAIIEIKAIASLFSGMDLDRSNFMQTPKSAAPSEEFTAEEVKRKLVLSAQARTLAAKAAAITKHTSQGE